MELNGAMVIAGFIVSLLTIGGVFAGIIASYTQLKTEKKNLEKKVDENRLEFEEEVKEMKQTIKELQESKNQTNESLVRLTTILDSLNRQVSAIDKKLDDLKHDIIRGGCTNAVSK